MTSSLRRRLCDLGITLACFLGSWGAQPASAQVPPGQNVFYLDRDQDGYGDPSTASLLPTSTPPNRLWVPWGNDPDDSNPYIFPLPRPRQNRVLAIDADELTGDDVMQRIQVLRELGATTLLITLRWNQLEPSAGSFSPTVIAHLSSLAEVLTLANLSVVISLDVIDGTQLALPADLMAMALDSATVRSRAEAALGQLKQALGATPVKLLRLGSNVDRYQSQNAQPLFWSGYKALVLDMKARAHELWSPALPVGVSSTWWGTLLEPTRSIMGDLQTACDWVIADFSLADTTIMDPRQTKAFLEYLIAAANGKPLALWPIAFPSGTDVSSSEVLQSQFYQAFFQAWDVYAAQVPLAVVSRLDDNVAASPPTARSTGLRQANQTPKAALATLRHLGFERGWWEIATPLSRKFFMGFTLTPYDTPSDPYEQLAVAAYVDQKVAQHGDLVALHMDGGVPWMEALYDDFTTSLPPYSASVLGAWWNYKTRIPAGKKLLVSINPLGIPRNVLAPYWGYGQGFTYDASFNRLPDGQYADDERRIPPGAFNELSFDAPAVQYAFLKYAMRAISYFNPDYLCFAIEVSATDVADAAAFQRYLSLHRFVYTELKKIPAFAHVKILVSFSATSFMADEFGHLIQSGAYETGSPYKYDEMKPGMRDRLKQGVRDLVPYVDLIGLSVYPHYGKYNAYTEPAGIFESMRAFLKEAGVPDSMPIAVTESGYAGEPYALFNTTLYAGSADKQKRHLELMLYELSKAPNPVEFVVNYLVRDSDMQWRRMLAAQGANDTFTQFYQFFRNIGVYDGNGLPRPALDTWSRYFQLPMQR